MVAVNFDRSGFESARATAWEQYHKSPKNRHRVEPYFIALRPWGSTGMIEHGKFLYAMGCWDEALERFRSLSQVSRLARVYEAQLLFWAGRHKEALQAYTDAKGRGSTIATVLLPVRTFQMRRDIISFLALIASIPFSAYVLISSFGRAADIIYGIEDESEAGTKE